MHASLAARITAHSLGAGAEAMLVWHAGLLRFQGKELGEQATNQPVENVIDNQCSDPSVALRERYQASHPGAHHPASRVRPTASSSQLRLDTTVVECDGRLWP